MSELRSFDFGPRFGNLLIHALFLGLFSALSAVAAFMDGTTETRFGVVLSERGSRVFFGVSLFAFAAGAVWIVTRTEPDSLRKNTLTLGPESIELNRSGLNPHTASVPYERIVDVRHLRNRKQDSAGRIRRRRSVAGLATVRRPRRISGIQDGAGRTDHTTVAFGATSKGTIDEHFRFSLRPVH